MKRAKKCISLILTLCIIFSVLLVNNVINPTKVSASEIVPVSIAVDWSSVKSSTTPLSFGLNGFQFFNPSVSSNPKYISNMEYMNIRFIRLHSVEATGGDNISDPRNWVDDANKSWLRDRIYQSISGFKAANNPTIFINITDWPKWMKTYNFEYKPGATVTLLDPSEFDNYANYCAELVKIVNVEYGFNIKYWEPTNERDDIYYVKMANEGLQNDKLDELIEIHNRCAKAMKAVDPTIKVGGLAFARGDLYNQITRFIRGTKDQGALDFISMHFYANGDLNQSDEYVYNRVNNPYDPSNGTLTKHTRDVRNILDTEVPSRHVPLFLNEFNISWTWTNNDPRMHNHKGAVYDALCLVYAHDSGADGTNAWNEYDGVYGKMNSSMQLQPNAHLYQIFNNYLVGSRATTATSDAAKIVPFAVLNPSTGNKSLLVINRSDDVQVVRTTWNESYLSTMPIQQHQISELGYSIAVNSWSRAVGQGLVVPAHSVTLLTDNTNLPSINPPSPVVIAPDDTPPSTPTPTPGGGISTGLLNVTVAGSPASVNLSKEGILDWAHWGLDSVTSYTYKANVPRMISEIVKTGDGELSIGTGGVKHSWNDGSPVVNITDTNKYLAYNGGPGKGSTEQFRNTGLRFTVPADRTARTLRIYAGVYGLKARLKASLSDGSAPEYITSNQDSAPDVINNSGGSSNKVITITYKAASDNQMLTIDYLIDWDHWGNKLWLYGATLSIPDLVAPSIPTGLSLITKSSTTAALKWEASTDNIGVTGYNIYNGNKLMGSTSGSNTYFINGLIPGSTYNFSVRAKDATGNISDGSGMLTVTTDIRDLPILDRVTLNSVKSVLKPMETSNIQVNGVMSDNTAAEMTRAQILYTSSNEQVARVDGNGTVTAVSEGVAIIKAVITLDGVSREDSLHMVVNITPVIENGIYRGIQMGERVFIERALVAGYGDYDADGDGWALLGRTNGQGENGILEGLYIVNNVPYAILKAYTVQMGEHYRIITPPTMEKVQKGQTRITPVIEQFSTSEAIGQDNTVQVGVYGAKQVGERVHILRNISTGIGDYDADGDGWALLGRTNGEGENGTLVAFFVDNQVPYAVVKAYSVQKGWHYRLITPPSLEQVKKGQTRITPVITIWPAN